MHLTSKAIKQGQPIPRRFTADGENVSPPLTWTDVPARTKELAIIMEDPDAPRAKAWVHWIVYGLKPDRRRLPEGIPHHAAVADPPMLQGQNSFEGDNIGYRGPAPPRGDGPHHYYFRIYALDQRVRIESEASLKYLQKALADHVLESAELMGTYER